MTRDPARKALATGLRLVRDAETKANDLGVDPRNHNFRADDGSFWRIYQSQDTVPPPGFRFWQSSRRELRARIGQRALAIASGRTTLVGRNISALRNINDGSIFNVLDIRHSWPDLMSLGSSPDYHGKPYKMTNVTEIGTSDNIAIPVDLDDDTLRSFMSLTMNNYLVPYVRRSEKVREDIGRLTDGLRNLSNSHKHQSFDGNVYNFRLNKNLYARISSASPELLKQMGLDNNEDVSRSGLGVISMGLIAYNLGPELPDQIVASLKAYPDLSEIDTGIAQQLTAEKIVNTGDFIVTDAAQQIGMINLFNFMCEQPHAGRLYDRPNIADGHYGTYSEISPSSRDNIARSQNLPSSGYYLKPIHLPELVS